MNEFSWINWFLARTWIIEIGIALFILVLLNFVLQRILLRSKRLAQLKEHDPRTHLDYAALIPARVLLWILLGSFLIELLMRELKISASFVYISALRDVGIVACLAWFLLRWKKVFYSSVLSKASKKSVGMGVDPLTLEVVQKIYTVAVVFIALLITLQRLGLNVIPLITFGGIGAAAIGFSAKDAISNFFGGFMIYMTRPFMVNDLVELPRLSITGNIEEIGWYTTTIRDLNKKPIYIPNAVFSTEALVNVSRITHRRIDEVVSIRYEDIQSVSKIIEEIQTLLQRHSAIDHHQSYYAFLRDFSDGMVRIEVRAYVLCTRYEDFMEVKQEIFLEINNILQKAGAKIPHPLMSLFPSNSD